MCERAFVTKLTVPLDKPSADTFRLTGFVVRMGKGARDAGGTGANLEKLARNVREVLGCGGKRISRPRAYVKDKLAYFWQNLSLSIPFHGPCRLCRGPSPDRGHGWTRDQHFYREQA